MKVGEQLRRWMCALAVAPACLSCWDVEQCAPELEQGDTVIIEVGEQFDPNNGAPWEPETCHLPYGIGPGVTLEGTVTAPGDGRSCVSVTGPLSSWDGIELVWQDEADFDRGGAFGGIYRYQLDESDCEGELVMNSRSDQIPTSEWNRQGSPPGDVTFRFRPDEGAAQCPSACSVRFGTSLTQQ